MASARIFTAQCHAPPKLCVRQEFCYGMIPIPCITIIFFRSLFSVGPEFSLINRDSLKLASGWHNCRIFYRFTCKIPSLKHQVDSRESTIYVCAQLGTEIWTTERLLCNPKQSFRVKMVRKKQWMSHVHMVVNICNHNISWLCKRSIELYRFSVKSRSESCKFYIFLAFHSHA